ncbi:hypothetical protein N8482_00380 [Chitinophagales bacterium]|nr:hypothetical protein [Chitinophagales bacterium]
MKSKIEFREVHDVGLAIVPEFGDAAVPIYQAYLINLKSKPLKGVFVVCSGHGVVEGTEIETSTLRVMIEELGPESIKKLDAFPREAAGLKNEYWVSFKLNEYLYDRKFTFEPGDLDEDNYEFVPILERVGVIMH